MTVPPPSRPPSQPCALSVADLVVSYDSRRVVDGLGLTASAGAITAVLGPNGAGKTTTIECAEGLRRPDSGTISVLGHAPGSLAARAATGVMLQDAGLPMARSVTEVLRLTAAVRGVPASRVAELLDLLDLHAVASTPVRRLSGGQRQRLAFAVAIAADPRLVFLDEPSAGLDPHARARVWQVVRELRERGTAVVLTTHLLQEAEELADQVHVVVAGRVVASGTPGELTARYAGTDTLQASIARPLTAPEAADLTARLAPAGLAPDGLEVDGAALQLAFDDGAGRRATAALASWCAENDVTLLSLRAGGGTFEHAYLTLTAAALALADERGRAKVDA